MDEWPEGPPPLTRSRCTEPAAVSRTDHFGDERHEEPPRLRSPEREESPEQRKATSVSPCGAQSTPNSVRRRFGSGSALDADPLIGPDISRSSSDSWYSKSVSKGDDGRHWRHLEHASKSWDLGFTRRLSTTFTRTASCCYDESSSPKAHIRRHSTVDMPVRSGGHTKQQAEAVAKENQQRCKELLERVQRNEEFTEAELEQEFEALFKYKNRYITARPLHQAIYLAAHPGDESASLVRAVLEAKANVRSKASYIKDKKRNDLEAIHIAAGLGCVPAMRALVEKAEDQVALLNTYCVLRPEERSPLHMAHQQTENFYVPLHDAAYLGHKDAVIWLLENRADASLQNRDGYTALHWIASKGAAAGDDAMVHEGDLEAMVRSLLKHKARLDVMTHQKSDNKEGRQEGKIPLELAAADDSQFPRRLLHLLAPSFQGSEQADSSTARSFFNDMCLLGSLNIAAANQLARQLLESSDPAVHARVRADAQKDNAVDRMANLFHMAPEAAADMLDILMVKPLVEDPGRHPIRTRANMWGLFYGRPMRCAYKADAATKANLKWPQWKYDSEKKDDRTLKDQPELVWHLQLISQPEHGEERREYVDDVDTKVVLLPNVLDIDIFMALSFAGPAHSKIFAKLPVQGIICCLWDHLVLPAVYLRMGFAGLELFVQAWWGLTNVEATTGTEDTNAPMFAPLCWSIIAAGLLRDVFNLVWWFGAHYRKYCGHYGKYCQWKDTSDSLGNARERPPSLHSLWRPQAFLLRSAVLAEVFLYALKAAFLYEVSGFKAGPMADTQQALLTANTVLQFFRIVYMLRLTNYGKKITTILSAFFSGAIIEMLVVTSLFFASVCLAFAMLKRKHSVAGIMLYLYRGLLFGDGDSLDYMGLDPKDHVDGYSVRTVFMLLATLLFNIVILNLTIAVYGSEYERLERESELHFQRERAKYCCELLLSMQKLHLRESGDEWIPLALKISAFGSFTAAIMLYLFPGGSITRSVVSACLLATSQITVQAVGMASGWFPSREGDREGPSQEHFLWICHRASFSEDRFTSDELNQEAVEALMDERLGRLEEKLVGQVDRLDSKVDAMAAQLEGKLDGLNEQLVKLLQLQASNREEISLPDR